MPRPITWTIVTCLVLITLAQGAASYTQYQGAEQSTADSKHLASIESALRAPRPTQWQYTIESIPDLRFDAAIGALGKEGWELVFARRAQDSAQNFAYECIFKRPL
jgi:hypothetical protein